MYFIFSVFADMSLIYVLIIMLIIYSIIVVLLTATLARYYRRAYGLRQNLDQVLDQMIYIHATYFYDLRQTGFDVQQIDRRFEPKTKRIMQAQHMSIDTISCYQSLKQIAEESMILTSTRLFDPKMIQDTDMLVEQLSDAYQTYQKIKQTLI